MEIDFETYTSKIEMYAPGYAKNGMLCWVDYKRCSSDREKVIRTVLKENEKAGCNNHCVVEFVVPTEITGAFHPR